MFEDTLLSEPDCIQVGLEARVNSTHFLIFLVRSRGLFIYFLKVGTFSPAVSSSAAGCLSTLYKLESSLLRLPHQQQ